MPLSISEVKQIAGRAGRFKTAHQAVNADSPQKSIADIAADPTIGLDDVPSKPARKKAEETTIGWVTTLDQIDHSFLRMTMKREPKEIKSAGLFPPSGIVERFASYFPPGTPFSYILLRLHEISELHPRFHLCTLKDQLAIADAIHTVRDLTTQDRITICAAPVKTQNPNEKKFLIAMAECIAGKRSGNLLDLQEVPLDVMDQPASRDRRYLYGLEELHKMLVCYLWLSYRFPNVFTTRSLANYAKKLVEEQIESTLSDFSFIKQARANMIKTRSRARTGLDKLDGEPESQNEIQDQQTSPSLGMLATAEEVDTENNTIKSRLVLNDNNHQHRANPQAAS